MFRIKTIGSAELLDGVLKSGAIRHSARGVARRGIDRLMFRVKTIGSANLLAGVLKSSDVRRAPPRADTTVDAAKSRSQRTRRCSAFFAIVHDFAATAR
jgi:hypothetical protein